MGRSSTETALSRSSVTSNNRIYTACSSTPSTSIISTRSSSPERGPSHQVENDDFLTALAAHERRVLELREELQKAEIELHMLKKQWAAHEATKKRDESRHIEQLRPLKSVSYAGIMGPQDLSRVLKGPDRKEDRSSSTRAAQRKVFSGSRHTRTLSLLSPRTSSSLHVAPRGHHQTPTNEEAQDINASKTSRYLGSQPAHRQLQATSDKDAILETGKQIVGDFRHGLWTFFEDLKQVTVGEEASRFAARDLPHLYEPESKKVIVPKARASTFGEHAMRIKSEKTVLDKCHQAHSRHISVSKADRSSPKGSRQAGSQEHGDGAARGDVGMSISSDSDDGWDNWETLGTEPANTPNTNGRAAAEPMVSFLTGVITGRASSW